MLNENNYKKIIDNFNDGGWGNSYLKYAAVFMLGNRCVVSQYIQLDDQK